MEVEALRFHSNRNRETQRKRGENMKREMSAVGAIVLATSLLFVGCNERNEREGIGSAPSEQNQGQPMGPGGPRDPERPNETTNR